MKLLITVLYFFTLTSCSPDYNFPDKEKPPPPATEQPTQPNPTKSNTMRITIGDATFSATLATSASVTAFKAMLPLTLSMSDFNSNEKVAGLPHSLTAAATNSGTISAGDIMLYGSSSLVLFYETFFTSYSYTKLGRIDNTAGLKAALGSGNVTIKFEKDGN